MGWRFALGWTRKRTCILVTIACLVFGAAVFWGVHTPPPVKFTPESATSAQVLAWAQKTAKCSTSGAAALPLMNTSNPDVFSYRCSTAPREFGHPAYFTIMVVLVCFALLIKDYPPELVLITTAIILYIAGVLNITQGSCVCPCVRANIGLFFG